MASVRGTLAVNGCRSWKETVKRALPQLVYLVRFGRMMANQVRYPVAATILDWRGRVINGPFMGMRYARSGMVKFSQMLGTYERCLIPVVERVIEQRPRVIIDVGAAYGYYALGFARRCPGSRIIAYEQDSTRLDLMRKYCHLNRLDDRVETRSACTVTSLDEDLKRSPGAFVFMDAEGAEDELLSPQIRNIEQSEMLVELHEMFVPGVTGRLRERFAPTHMSSVIPQAAIQSQPDDANWFIRSFWRQLNTEDRNEQMAWLHLVPRAVAYPA